MVPKLTNYLGYRRFIGERNRALAFSLQKNQLRLTAVVDELKKATIDICLRTQGNLQATQAQLQLPFQRAIKRCVNIIVAMRKLTYGLTYAAEGEAITRVLGGTPNTELTHSKLSSILSQEMPSGGPIEGRVRLAFARIHRRVMDAMERHELKTNASREDLEDSLSMAFPRRKRYKRVTRALRAPVKEANPIKGRIVTSELWDSIVKEFTDEFLFKRGGKDVTLVKAAGQTIEVYDWELEREVTNDFVQLVRLGQVDAALENGIEDFVWIAIIDDKTDDCCLWRDGKTTAEIEKLLKTTHRDDECGATVPPAHFNCRCDLAPVTGKLQSIAPLELGDFSTWLK